MEQGHDHRLAIAISNESWLENENKKTFHRKCLLFGITEQLKDTVVDIQCLDIEQLTTTLRLKLSQCLLPFYQHLINFNLPCTALLHSNTSTHR